MKFSILVIVIFISKVIGKAGPEVSFIISLVSLRTLTAVIFELLAVPVWLIVILSKLLPVSLVLDTLNQSMDTFTPALEYSGAKFPSSAKNQRKNK